MNIKADFDCFIGNLIKAAAIMDDHYFQLTVAGSEKPIFRERVYCYELYHQLRLLLGNNFPYKLDGEVDKAGHPIITLKIGAKKPDFIVHVPGEMSRNLVVIEVKSVDTELDKLRGDLLKLEDFTNKGKANYHYAIMLIYGNGNCDLPTDFKAEAERWLQTYSEKKRLLWQQGPRIEPTVIE